MSCSLDEWFRENILPKLKKFMESEEPGQYYETKCAEFFDMLKVVVQDHMYNARKDDFATALLEVVVGDEPPEIHSRVQKCFRRLDTNDDKELISITYNDGADLVTCKYNAAEDQD